MAYYYVFKKEDKKDPSAKGADVLSATPTLAHPVRRKFEAAQFRAADLYRIY
ncbi:hypothetical protein J8TS2_23850 [Lederbergia ruris]|uniref:Uncharacterized protein n=1 Tax=Lederbergia ruris TaxID=217495 RepID=A0ABQ4KKQ8_9BACI|nr:hypothetical protein J8TS2_23850 [Lederbergia ruris]